MPLLSVNLIDRSASEKGQELLEKQVPNRGQIWAADGWVFTQHLYVEGENSDVTTVKYDENEIHINYCSDAILLGPKYECLYFKYQRILY